MAAHLGDGQVVDRQTLITDMNADLPALLRSYSSTDEQDTVDDAGWDADDLLTKWTKRGWVRRSPTPAAA